MALQNTTTLRVAETEITAFKSISLFQEIDAHHDLEVVCRMDVLENLSATLGEASKNFLGEIITLQTASLDTLSGYKNLEFKGIVTEIKTIKGHDASSGDSVIIRAQSPSFLADDGPHYTSFNDHSLSEILEKSFQDYDKSKLNIVIQPKNNSALQYSVQHNESTFEYTSRLAAQYGEWFYYNGTQLVFGTPENKELVLNYGFDLKEYHLSLKPLSNNYNYFSNDYLLQENHQKQSQTVPSNSNGYNGFVSNKAQAIFRKESTVWHNLYTDPTVKQRLDYSIENQKKAIEINQVQLSGISDNPGVTLGGIITIEGARYRVISIVHSNNETGDYQNQFLAISAEWDAYPKTNINAFPKSESQTATVIENADPEGYGRIRVQFPWQKSTGEMTPWIRIVTPHAGGDKGFHFIPEQGEEVLIDFEAGNAEQPYMLGSLYNGSGKADAFKDGDNNIKAIRTRSGHTIELNDTKNSEFITITDVKGNHITIDTANNNITVTALENMTFNAKNMQFNVEENLDISVGQNKSETINETHTISSMNENKHVAEEIKVISATYKQEAQEITTDASGEITTNAGGKISIASAQTIEYGE